MVGPLLTNIFSHVKKKIRQLNEGSGSFSIFALFDWDIAY